MTYQLTTLPSGLRVASESLPQMETVALAISVDVGARHETAAQHGVSHLLEHMAFKGTARFSALDIAEKFDAIGGHLNAFTSHEHTVYYAKVLAEHVPLAADMLCDIVQHSLLPDDELEKEKQVIVQELAMHHDTPDDLVFDYFQEAAFANQALGRSILGTEEKILAHSSEDIHRFVAAHYRAPRIVVSAAGNIAHDDLCTLMAQHMTLGGKADAALEPARYVGGEAVIEKDLEQLQLVIGLQALPITDARYSTLVLLSNLLGGGMSSRLFQEIREKRGLVYTIQSMVSSYADVGMLGIYAATAEDKAEELLEVVCRELATLATTITQEELTRAQQQHIASLRMARESTATLAEWIGRHLLHYGEYRDAATMSRIIAAVTLDDVRALCREIFAAPALTFAALGPTRHVPNAAQLAAWLQPTP